MEKTKQPHIQDRESWFKIIWISLLVLSTCVMILISPYKIDFTKFDFVNFLFLIIALFSIGLSVAFYFKATEYSNDFYDNMYNFTKDISVVLGRMEATFGERLIHLNEGQQNLLNNLTKKVEEKEEEIEEDRRNVTEKEQELENLAESIAKREPAISEADLAEELKKKAKELAELQAQLKYSEEVLSTYKDKYRDALNSTNQSEQVYNTYRVLCNTSLPRDIKKAITKTLQESGWDVRFVISIPTNNTVIRATVPANVPSSAIDELLSQFGIGIESIKRINKSSIIV